jgi:acyl-CoA thioesterase-1
MNRPGLRPPARIISGKRILLLLLGLLAALAGPGCRDAPPPPDTSTAPPPTPATTGETDEAPEGVDDRPVILFVGTSLTAGYGVDPSEAYPAVIQQKLDGAGLDYRVVNAGVSGETSAGALRRMDWLLRQRVAVLVVETGANDGLRGQDPEATRANIQAIFDRARRQEPPPQLVVVAMEALPNYGEDYRQGFRAIYPELAEANGAALVPFLLEGVAGRPELNQADGIHPTAEGHERVAENVWKTLEPLLVEDNVPARKD